MPTLATHRPCSADKGTEWLPPLFCLPTSPIYYHNCAACYSGLPTTCSAPTTTYHHLSLPTTIALPTATHYPHSYPTHDLVLEGTTCLTLGIAMVRSCTPFHCYLFRTFVVGFFDTYYLRIYVPVSCLVVSHTVPVLPLLFGSLIRLPATCTALPPPPRLPAYGSVTGCSRSY